MPIPDGITKVKYKLVNRLADEVYFDNLKYTKGVELLHSAKKENKMLITIDYVFLCHSTMGYIWAPR